MPFVRHNRQASLWHLSRAMTFNLRLQREVPKSRHPSRLGMARVLEATSLPSTWVRTAGKGRSPTFGPSGAAVCVLAMLSVAIPHGIAWPSAVPRTGYPNSVPATTASIACVVGKHGPCFTEDVEWQYVLTSKRGSMREWRRGFPV